MARNKNTAAVVTEVVESDVIEAPVEDVNPDEADGTTEAEYVPVLETIVDDYKAGRVNKAQAKKWLETNMLDSILGGKLDHAQSYAGVIQQLDDASRTGGRKAADGIDSDDYAAAILARAEAFIKSGNELLAGLVIPSDVPAKQHDEVRTALAAHADGSVKLIIGDDLLKAASEPVEGMAKSRVIGNNALVSHLADIVAGKANNPDGFPFTIKVGQTYRVSEIANLRTATYPEGVSSGHVASRFTHNNPERFPAGWVYAKAPAAHGQDKVHGVRYVGTDDQA